MSTRRDFVKTTCLSLAFTLPMEPKLRFGMAAPAEPDSALAPSAFLRIDRNGAITIWANKSEMGQGIRTSMAMAVAEELGADWSRVKVQQASSAAKFGDLGITGGSQSTRGTFKPYRIVGATAREMLISAAANRWKVNRAACRAEMGFILHGKKRIAFGDLVKAASKLEPPKDPPLRDPKDFHIVGTDVKRVDGPDIVTGRAQFGSDLKLPGMLYASVERCPVFGGKLKSMDDSAAKAVPGVKRILAISSGVAVLADSTWAALRGREALKLQWDEGAHATASTAEIRKDFEARLKAPGKVVRKEGEGLAAMGGDAVHARYDCPFLAHATMEPMVGVADVRPDRCDIYAPSQGPGWSMAAIQQLTGLKAEQIEVHIPLLGGGFGRRAMPDFILEAVECSKAAGAPVKVQYSREDDTQHDYYRPGSLHDLSASLDEKGRALAWHHRFTGPSIAASLKMPWPPEAAELSGAADLAYEIPNLQVEWAQSDTPIPVGFWRAVPASFNPFVTESFLDELAHKAGKNPLAFRLGLLKQDGKRKVGKDELDASRLRQVIELAAAKAGWKAWHLAKHPKGRGMGIAAHAYLDCGTYVAEVAEVEVKPDGAVKVHRVVCAVDCGLAVNPLNIRAQMESGIIYGLSAALHGEITLEKGRVAQGNFNDYPVLRLADTPKIEVHIVKSDLPPGGVGEPGLPPIAPAVANAIFAATGKRIRSLPMTPGKILKAGRA
ncbi:MAG: xanthine dehydrogenase family protein molybdopterin-binding subunit [Holophagaceae bacterium]|nr:xanthine dehydrogenase family protein molybdopterin-binding subunit [Holophagaceae bacterium]